MKLLLGYPQFRRLRPGWDGGSRWSAFVAVLWFVLLVGLFAVLITLALDHFMFRNYPTERTWLDELAGDHCLDRKTTTP